ncbi:MAG: hypothetical protein ACQEQE_11325 [Bacillota bacterium]
MSTLIKFEWKRKYKYVLIALSILLLINLYVNLSHSSQETDLLAKSLMINSGLFFIAYISMFIIHVRNMNKLLFTNKGQFKFLLPISSYKILGGFLINVILDIILVSITFGVVYLISMNIYDKTLINQAVNTIKMLDKEVITKIPLVFTQSFVSYASLLMTIFLAMILVKTLLFNKPFKKLISFVFFVIISYLNSMIMKNIYNLLGSSLNIYTILLINLISLSLLYIFSGYLLENKTSA